jgi:uncharacterized protein YdhG (YjbR/CyaY superfamily)
MNSDSTIQTIDEYIAGFPEDIREILEKVRETIRQAAPDATEKISYQMPTFYLNGNLVHFAAFKKHIGLYPAPSGVEAFQEELAPYVKAKGSIQFPLDKPIPYNLIGKIAAFRVKENADKAAVKKKK